MAGGLNASWRGRVAACAPVSIHGDQYWDVQVALEQDAGETRVRVPSHVCASAPSVGARVEITTLLGQVTALRALDDDA